MMIPIINTLNGVIFIDDILIFPLSTKSEIAEKLEGLNTYFQFDIYESCSYKTDDIIIGFNFKELILTSLNISLEVDEKYAFIILKDFKEKILELYPVELFQEYTWGRISYAEDIKGGAQSILIQYK